MDFNSALLLDCGPARLKLLLHLGPNFEGLSLKFGDLNSCRLLKLVKPVLALHGRSHDHEVLQLPEGAEGLVSAPGRLNFDCGEHGPVRTLEHDFGVGHRFPYLLQVDDQRQQVLLAILVKFQVCKLDHTLSVQVAEVNLVLRDHLFYLLHQVGEATPSSNVLPFEGNELGGRLVDFTLSD